MHRLVSACKHRRIGGSRDHARHVGGPHRPNARDEIGLEKELDAATKASLLKFRRRLRVDRECGVCMGEGELRRTSRASPDQIDGRIHRAIREQWVMPRTASHPQADPSLTGKCPLRAQPAVVIDFRERLLGGERRQADRVLP